MSCKLEKSPCEKFGVAKIYMMSDKYWPNIFRRDMASKNIKFFISTMQYSGFSGVKIHRILTRKHGDVICLRRVQSLMTKYSSGRREGIVDGRKKSGGRKSNIRHDSIDSVKLAIKICLLYTSPSPRD